MRRLKIVLTACLALGAISCSGGGGGDSDGGVFGDGGSGRGDSEVSSEAKPYADALAENFTTPEEGEIALNTEEAGCVAPKWVDTMTPERLKEAGVQPADLAGDENEKKIVGLGLGADEAASMIDAFGDCDVDLKGLYIDGLADDGSLTDEDRACLDDAISDQLLKDVLVIGLTEGDAAFDEESGPGKEFVAALRKCPGATGDGG